MSSKIAAILLSLLLITRFFGLFWGNGFFFHPDENNMASSVSQFTQSNLNPHFYAYGQFPLYLAYYSLNLLNLPNTFSNSVYALRFWSAVFSILSVIVFYYISRLLFSSQKASILFVLLLVFSPGLIQLAHFGTTESLMILVFALNLLLAIRLLLNPDNYFLYFLAALNTGIGLASKISALIFIFPVLIVFIINAFKTRRFVKHFLVGLSLLVLTISVFALFSPYNLIEYSDFISAFRYETEVANGTLPVFYTNQFIQTLPIIFQFIKILPYASGLPVLLFSFFGLIILIKTLPRSKRLPWILILTSALFYLLYFSSRYVKWTRFSSPIFFLFPLLSVYALMKIKQYWPLALLTLFMLAPGLQFFRLYFLPDTRIQADTWINQHIPPSSKIFSEAGNVINLPLQGNYDVINFDFYNLDQNQELWQDLPLLLSQADYILVPSRRIFKNQKGPMFPYSDKYYHSLFSGRLGFQEMIRFENETSYPLNSENAEETWSVFDHPVVRIYQKVENLSYEDIKKLLTP